MEDLFKALADPTRRTILDGLRLKDGQTLTAIEKMLETSGASMTRFGVMKHLKVLEAAHLVTTRRVGRFKYHYLNVMPLQEALQHWIEPLVQQPLATQTLSLKTQLEGTPPMTEAAKPDFILETFIRTTPERLWKALTDPEESAAYHFFGAKTVSTFEKGAPIEHILDDGTIMLKGTVLDAEKYKRLETTFLPDWMPEAPASRVVYEIEDYKQACKFTILHYDIPPGLEGVSSGWSEIVSSLKSYLETGEALLIPNDGYQSPTSNQ